MPGQENSQATRRTRYTLYLEQIRCLNTMLGQLFDRLRESGDYEDATIIVHGDHGSRIAITDPKERYRDQLIDSDYSDAFSTLFAVKTQDIEPVYDSKAATVQDLLLFATGKTKTPARSNTVYLRVKDRGQMVPQALPDP